MIVEFNFIVLTLVVVCAGMSLWIKDLMSAAIVFGAYSFLMCLVWAGMGAVDVAFTEAAVGAGVSTVFFVATIYNTVRTIRYSSKKPDYKLFAGIIVLITGGILLSAINDFPTLGDPHSPANSHVAKYYVEHTLADTAVPNFVTAVLADYRGFDTMFETAVVFVAMMGIMALLLGTGKNKPPHFKNDSVIIRVASRFMTPFMQIFALYVVAHGHHSPGGGFQGGVILGASLILLGMSFQMKEMVKHLSAKWMVMIAAIGVLIYSGIGVVAMMLKGNFLDYSVWHKILPGTDAIMARSHGMLGVEIGVALTVMCGMVGIYAYMASDGRLDRGL